MIEHRYLQIERKQLTMQNYVQLGLDLPGDGTNQKNLEPFHQKALESNNELKIEDNIDQRI